MEQCTYTALVASTVTKQAEDWSKTRTHGKGAGIAWRERHPRPQTQNHRAWSAQVIDESKSREIGAYTSC